MHALPPLHRRIVNTAAFSPNARTLTTASDDEVSVMTGMLLPPPITTTVIDQDLTWYFTLATILFVALPSSNLAEYP